MIVRLLRLILWPLALPLTLIRWAVWRLGKTPRTLRLSLEGHHPHRPPQNIWRRTRPALSRRAIRRILTRAAEDRRVDRVLVRVGALAGGWATLFELRAALADARSKGLRIEVLLAWGDTRTLWLASAADAVHIQPNTLVMATGVGAEMTFFGEVLDKAGVELEVIAAGTFKSAMEPFTRTAPTDANREAINALLDDLYQRLVTDLAEGRGLEPEAIRELLDNGPYEPEQIVEAGLADAVTDPEEFFPDDLVSARDYGGPPSPWPRLPKRPRLGLIEVTGMIRDGLDEDPNPTGATTRAVCDSLDAARESKRVKGVLLHIDSGGGSASASERMWQSVRALAAEKPVVVWMGDAAASGGYYVASAAHHIVAAPGTLTGSIGVIMAKPVLAGLLGKLGLHRVRFERGPHAQMLSPSRSLDDHERAALERHIQQTYRLFLDRVCAGRDRETEWLEPIAEGRVWTGQQGLAHGLVDSLGSELDALAVLAEKAGVPADPRRLRLIQPHRGLLSRLRPSLTSPTLEMLRVAEESPVLAWCPVSLR